MEKQALQKKHFSAALAVQNACNLSGILHSFLEAVQAIREEVQSTDAINEHPITILYVDKIKDLVRINDDKVFDAYNKIKTALELYEEGILE
jgi:hypothetical protein